MHTTKPLTHYNIGNRLGLPPTNDSWRQLVGVGRRCLALVGSVGVGRRCLKLVGVVWRCLALVNFNFNWPEFALLFTLVKRSIHPVFFQQLLFKQQGFKNLRIKQSEGFKI